MIYIFILLIFFAPTSIMLTEDNKKHIDDKKKNIPWVEKYRPSNLNDVIAHEEIVRTSNFV